MVLDSKCLLSNVKDWRRLSRGWRCGGEEGARDKSSPGIGRWRVGDFSRQSIAAKKMKLFGLEELSQVDVGMVIVFLFFMN